MVERDLLIFSGLGKNGFAHVDTFLLSVKTNADETAKKYEKLSINVSQKCILHPFTVLEAPFCQKKVKIVVPCCTCISVSLLFIENKLTFNIDCCTKGAKIISFK